MRAGLLDPLAGRGAAVVGQDLGAFDDERLPLVDFRHLALELREALLQRFGDFGMEDQLAVERGGHGVAREIVLGGPQAAGEDHDFGARDGAAHGVRQAVQVVADDATW